MNSNAKVGSMLYRNMSRVGKALYEVARIEGETKSQWKCQGLDMDGTETGRMFNVTKRTMKTVGGTGYWNALGDQEWGPQTFPEIQEKQREYEVESAKQKAEQAKHASEVMILANDVLQAGTHQDLGGPYRLMRHTLHYMGTDYELVYTVSDTTEFDFRTMKDVPAYELEATVYYKEDKYMTRRMGTYRNRTLHQAVKMAIVALVL